MKKLFILLAIAQLFAISCSSDEEQNLNPINTSDKVDIEMVTIPAGIYTRINESGIKQAFNFMSFKISKYETTVHQYIYFLNSKEIKKGQGYIWTNSNYNYGIKFDGKSWTYDPKYKNYPIGNATELGASECAKFYGGELPNYTRWEYACIGNSTGKFYTGDCLYNDQANYSWSQQINSVCVNNITNGLYEALEVGSFTPNQFGLYDMYGNVYEICTYNLNTFTLKGGSYTSSAFQCNHLMNTNMYSTESLVMGFRIVIL